jgi:hypothetical protein
VPTVAVSVRSGAASCDRLRENADPVLAGLVRLPGCLRPAIIRLMIEGIVDLLAHDEQANAMNASITTTYRLR